MRSSASRTERRSLSTVNVVDDAWRGALAAIAVLAFDLAARATIVTVGGKLLLTDALVRVSPAFEARLVSVAIIASGAAIAFTVGLVLGLRTGRPTAIARALTAIFVYATLDIIVRLAMRARVDTSLLSFVWYLPKVVAAALGAALVARGAEASIELFANTHSTTARSAVPPADGTNDASVVRRRTGRPSKDRSSGRTALMPVTALSSAHEPSVPPSGRTRVMPLTVQISRSQMLDVAEIPDGRSDDGVA